jgi:uncharacterized protein YqjF (DUF2071 family)
MYQDWLELLFVHYTLEPELVQSLLPPALTVDTFPDASGRARAWIGAVPFRMRNVRPRFVPPVPGLSAFLETNLRTYVHHEGHGPAVYFFSLDAANAFACRVARETFNLPYHHAKMSSRRVGERFDYATKRHSDGATLRANFSAGEALGPSEPGSLAYFLAERYLLVTPRRDGRLGWGRVHHRPYELRAATLHEYDETLSRAAGLPRGEPEHVCYCEGVATRVWPLRDTPD